MTVPAPQAKAARMESSETMKPADSAAPPARKKEGLKETTRFLLLLFLHGGN